MVERWKKEEYMAGGEIEKILTSTYKCHSRVIDLIWILQYHLAIVCGPLVRAGPTDMGRIVTRNSDEL